MSSSTTTTSGSNPSAMWQSDPNIAARYKAAENATRPFAKIMVELSTQLAPSTQDKEAPVEIFDLGCGTGAVEAEIYASRNGLEKRALDILAGDISPPMLAYLAERAKEEGWEGVQTQIFDGQKLAESEVLAGRAFEHIYVAFAIFMLPPDTPAKLAKLLKNGATLATSTWVDLPWFPVLKEAYARMADGPGKLERSDVWKAITNGLGWWDPAFVQKTLEEAGLKQVEVVTEKVRADCGTPENVMATMGFVLTVLSKAWPEEKREGWLVDVKQTFREVLVEQAGGEDKKVVWEFEGIVGVGVKEE
ncbi:hypothetical protein E8E13_009523 [Curvularia kusanoi]|uniref:Methyltransferase domain-containing protein n=1 Tax=Curvularia kusanoi TaxID=90978 RepID=A0A9P4TFZ6_CURKU|nr:hypothetical protein E8E13_009523 [Curvularia kusanoi]